MSAEHRVVRVGLRLPPPYLRTDAEHAAAADPVRALEKLLDAYGPYFEVLGLESIMGTRELEAPCAVTDCDQQADWSLPARRGYGLCPAHRDRDVKIDRRPPSAGRRRKELTLSQ